MKTRQHLSTSWNGISRWSTNLTAQRSILLMAMLMIPLGLHHVDTSALHTLVLSVLHMLSAAPFSGPLP